MKGSYDHVHALEKKGFLRCQENRSRAIEIIRDAEADKEEVASVPLLGNVAAGKPLFAEENLQGYVQVPKTSLGSSTHFALQVKGDSMKDAGIMDGDIVVVAAPEHGGQRRHRGRHGGRGRDAEAFLSSRRTASGSRRRTRSTLPFHAERAHPRQARLPHEKLHVSPGYGDAARARQQAGCPSPPRPRGGGEVRFHPEGPRRPRPRGRGSPRSRASTRGRAA